MTTTTTLFSDYVSAERSLPIPGSEVHCRGRVGTIKSVEDESARVVMVVVMHDTGRDAVLFLHETDAIYTR